MNFKSVNKKIIFIILVIQLFAIATVHANEYKINILDKNYQVSFVEEKGEQTGVYYDIFITVKNQGPDISDNITLSLYDEFDLPLSLNYTFDSDETKTFTFNDYPVIGIGSHEIRIELYPTNESLRKTSNTVTDTITLNYTPENETSTPGIEITFIFCTILFIGYYLKKKKQ